MIGGEGAVEVDAPAAACFALAARPDRAPDWQSWIAEARVVERDADDRPVVLDVVADARIRTLRLRLRYAFEPPHAVSWTYLGGDVSDVRGEYRFEALPGERTRVTHRLEVDPGRRLGLLLRGPALERVRARALDGTLRELKATVEAGGLR